MEYKKSGSPAVSKLRRVEGIYRKIRLKEEEKIGKEDIALLKLALNIRRALKNKRTLLGLMAIKRENFRSRKFANYFSMWLGYDMALEMLGKSPAYSIFHNKEAKKDIVRVLSNKISKEDLKKDLAELKRLQKTYGKSFNVFADIVFIFRRAVLIALNDINETVRSRN